LSGVVTKEDIEEERDIDIDMLCFPGTSVYSIYSRRRRRRRRKKEK